MASECHSNQTWQSMKFWLWWSFRTLSKTSGYWLYYRKMQEGNCLPSVADTLNVSLAHTWHSFYLSMLTDPLHSSNTLYLLPNTLESTRQQYVALERRKRKLRPNRAVRNLHQVKNSWGIYWENKWPAALFKGQHLFLHKVYFFSCSIPEWTHNQRQ